MGRSTQDSLNEHIHSACNHTQGELEDSWCLVNLMLLPAVNIKILIVLCHYKLLYCTYVYCIDRTLFEMSFLVIDHED